MKERILLTLFVLCMTLMFFPRYVSAENAVYSGTCGDNLKWNLDEGTGTLTIEGTGKMNAYYGSGGGTPWSEYKDIIRTVIIKSGVTSIGVDAFFECSSLADVSIPGSVTSIGDFAFHGCSSLTGVSIPEGVTSIECQAFSYCSSLESVTIPGSVTDIGLNAFHSCSGMTSLYISEGVIGIDVQAFAGCSSLTGVTIPASVTSIGKGAFAGCNSLTEFSVRSGNENYISKDGILYSQDMTELLQCPGGMTGGVTIPEGVTSIGESSFYDCSGLESIIIPGSVTSIGDSAFYGCSNLGSMTIPESVTGSIGYWAFGKCESLSSVIIRGSVTSIGNNAFSGCNSLSSVEMPGSVISIKHRAFNYCSSLKSITIPDSVTEIDSYAFEGCNSLSSVTIPDGVTSIGQSAFGRCSSLASIIIPSSVASIGSFEGCVNLRNIIIPDGVTTLGIYAFSGCKRLSSIVIPHSVTTIARGAFNGCSNLTVVYYGGSKSEWDSINIETQNDVLSSVALYYDVNDGNSGGSGDSSGTASEIDTGITKHTITFYSGIAGKSIPIDVDWGWDLFSQSSSVYDNRIATAGLALSGAAEYWQVNAEWTLRNLGYTTIASKNYSEEKYQYPAVTFGYRNLVINGEERYFLAIVVRGTTSAADWGTDASSIWGGFYRSADNIYSQMEDFMKNNCHLNLDSAKDNCRFFVTGHSLGGAVANIIAHKLNNEYSAKNIFGYTFASPTTTSLFDNIVAEDNIRNIVNEEDGIPKIPTVLGGGRYGKDMPFHRISYAYMGFYNHFHTLTGKWFDGDSAHAIEVYMSFLMSKGTMQGQKVVIIHVFCPVDVKIYTSAGLLAGNITDNKADGTISGKTYIHIEGDQKYIYLLDDDNYTISLTGTDTGTMEYALQNIDMDTGKTVSEKKFAGVQLFDGKQMSSDIEVKDGVVTGTDAELSNVKLFVLDDSGTVVKEVLPDGRGTEVAVEKKPENPDKPDKTSVKVKSIKISGISKKIAAGKKITLKAAVSPSNATNKSIIWKSSNKKYATVNNKGIVTLKKAGAGKLVTITASAKDGSGKKASYKIKIMKGKVKDVKISGKATRTAKSGTSVKLKASVKSSNGANKALQWKSSNTKYASVNGKGKVTLKKAGKGKTVKITAMATDGSGKKAVVKINIK